MDEKSGSRSPQSSDPRETERPGASAAPVMVLEGTDVQLAIAKYGALVSIISNIFSEFWTTNAFFITFCSVLTGSILSNWETFTSAPALATLGITLAALALIAVWYLSCMRHVLYTRLHMNHALQLETEFERLDVFTHRINEIRSVHWPSARRLWLAVPPLFAVIILILEIVGLADAPAKAETSPPVRQEVNAQCTNGI